MRYIYVKHYKRGATHDDGSTYICITCRIEKKLGDRSRANQAIVTAIRVNDTGSRLPVGYCADHVLGELTEDQTKDQDVSEEVLEEVSV